MKTNRKALLAVLFVLAVTLAIISASAFVFNAINTTAQSSATSGNGYYSNWMSEGQCSDVMGGNWGTSSNPTSVATTAQNSLLPLIGFITLIGAALTGTGGAAYYVVGRPKNLLTQPALHRVANTPSENVETPYDSVAKTLTADERKVVDVLTSHNGEYLQKYMRTETGLSRLKVHRIVTRLSERGIVTLEQTGNTNKVYLSSWLSKQPFSKIRPEEKINQEMVIKA